MKDIIQNEGILADGYGVIPQAVMRDKKLSVEAKALFSYFASFSSTPNVKHEIKTICKDMGMTEKEVRTYIAELNQYGFEIREG